MKITLRDYQEQTVTNIFNYLSEAEGNPLAVLPTGAGKSICIGSLVKDVYQYDKQAKVLILQHRQELIEQNFEKIMLCTDGQVNAGIYCAGLKRKEIYRKCVLANIASIYRASEKLDFVDLIIIDECHLLAPKENTMYHNLITSLKKRNPQLRVIGFTATPFRTSTGMLTDDDGFFDDICINVPIKKLIADGYLSPIISKSGITTPDTSGLHIRGGEFIDKEVAELYAGTKMKDILAEVRKLADDRKSILIFCAGVEQAEDVAKTLRKQGERAECLTGETGSLFRDSYINDFKKGKIKYLVNVGVLTTGFDAPNTDCLILLRATKSPGLYTQIIGRGMRIAPDKTNCLVLDFGGNIERHGPIDLIEVRKTVKKKNGKNEVGYGLFTGEEKIKTCPATTCRTVNDIEAKECIKCGHHFEEIKRDPNTNLETEASGGNIVSTEFEEYDIQETVYNLHEKNDKKMLKISYMYGFGKSVDDYLCFDHGGNATQNARQRWLQLAKSKDPKHIPQESEYALFSAETGDLKEVIKIRCRREKRFLKPIAWKFKTTETEIEVKGNTVELKQENETSEPFKDYPDYNPEDLLENI